MPCGGYSGENSNSLLNMAALIIVFPQLAAEILHIFYTYDIRIYSATTVSNLRKDNQFKRRTCKEVVSAKP